MLLSLLRFAAVVVAYQLLAIGLTILVPRLMPEYAVYYGLFNGLGDAQATLICLLLWDRFFGPHSVLLRRVAKTLGKVKSRRRIEVDYDGE